jgi:DNA-binding transcriptional LysR family regulator
LHIALRDGLDGIEAAVQAVSSRPWRAGVTVSVAPYFSAAWLTPRIMRFLHARPDIDLRLHHSYLPPDYRRDQVDIGINWGGGNWPGVVAEWVFDGSLTPVCSPEYLRSRGGFQEPGDMLSQPLFFEFRPEDWMQWFAVAQVPLARPPKATRIDDSSALRRIALDGNGIVLFFRSLAKEDLELGKLVQPFPQAVDTGCHYFLNYPADRNLPAAAQAFRRWLKAELPDLRA